MEAKISPKSFCSLLFRSELEFQIHLFLWFSIVRSRPVVDLCWAGFVVSNSVGRFVSALERLQRDVWNLARCRRSHSLFAAVARVNLFCSALFFTQLRVSACLNQSTSPVQSIIQAAQAGFSMQTKSAACCPGFHQQNKFGLKTFYPGCLFVSQNPFSFL